MRKIMYLLLAIIFFTGCIAIVDEGSEGRNVKSLIITKEETLEILDKTSQQTPDKEFEVKWPEKLKWPKK